MMDDGWMDRKKPGKYVVIFAPPPPPPGFAHLGTLGYGCNVDVVQFLIEKYPHALGQLCHASASLPLVGEGSPSQRSRSRAPQDQSQPAACLVEVIGDFEDDIDVEDNRKVRHSRSIWKYDLGWTDRRQRTDLDAGVVDSQ